MPLSTNSLASISTGSNAPAASPPPGTINPQDALERITSAHRPVGQGLTEWSSLSSADQLRAARETQEPRIELTRAEVHGGRVFVTPERDIRSDLPSVILPNNVGAHGFAPGLTTHDYLVQVAAPSTLRGPSGLRAVERALISNPTPGRDDPSSPKGTRNDVGRLVVGDNGDNFVRSYLIPSSHSNRSATVVNYTINGEHTMNEGFVMRFAELRADGRVELVTYGEGNALKQMEALSGLWEPIVEHVWTENAAEIFNAAQRR